MRPRPLQAHPISNALPVASGRVQLFHSTRQRAHGERVQRGLLLPLAGKDYDPREGPSAARVRAAPV